MERLSVTVLLAACGLLAQSPPAFEVATIKPTGPNPRGRFIRMQSTDRFEAQNHALNTLIAAAYNLSPVAISGGPSWVTSDRFDILAKTPGSIRPSLEEQMAMLRVLLADRFKLTFHREPKELSIYALEIARNGPKLKETVVDPDATPEGPPPLVFVLSPTLIRLPARYATMGEIASVMQRSSALDRPVLDRTGLTKRYDFDLEFSPGESVFGGIFPHPENPEKPELFEAMQQQLGLRLDATRGRIEAIVINHAERPVDN